MAENTAEKKETIEAPPPEVSKEEVASAAEVMLSVVKTSKAFKMYSDGIRSLIFSEGIEGKEVTDFLEIIGKDRPSEVDDDIVTLLWMKDLPHITYILAEDYLEFDAKGQAGSGEEGPAQQEKKRSLYKEIS